MVTLLFRKPPYSIHKVESLAKIGELKSLCDVVLLDDVPSINLLLQTRKFLTLEGWHPSSAWDAGFARHLRLKRIRIGLYDA